MQTHHLISNSTVYLFAAGKESLSGEFVMSSDAGADAGATAAAEHPV